MLGRLHDGVLELDEIHRFPNEPVHHRDALQWDILRLWHEMRHALGRVDGRLESIAVDAWGCDFALIGERGDLLENPYHYRDSRTDGIKDAVCQRVPAERIYEITGIQFLAFNTLFQLYAARTRTPRLIDAASRICTVPDLLNYWLTGELVAEYTNATTTQFVDARKRAWATDLLSDLDIPTRLLPPIVEPGTVIGRLGADVSAALAGVPVVAPACHDTGSAVASVAAGGSSAFLSSGTWSLLGTEVSAPIINARARQLNFTNEGGVCGTTRLLKNIGGLWLLQGCRRDWVEAGRSFAYDELLAAAEAETREFRSLVDPDHPSFLHPRSMVAAIDEYCRQTGQPAPEGAPGYVRAILESLAFKYRIVVESLEQLTARPLTEIRIVGGGARNRVLNQFTADATGRHVVAGPVEATALGNVVMQMVATGAAASLDEARRIVARSFPVERFEPRSRDRWDAQYARYKGLLELSCV